MNGTGPMAGESCVVSTKAYVFYHNPQRRMWDPLSQDRSVSRVQLLKRLQGGQTRYRLLARLENGPTVLIENLDEGCTLQATDKAFFQLQLSNDNIYGLKFTTEADAESFSSFVNMVLTPTTPPTPERRIEDDLPPVQLPAGPRIQRPVRVPFSTMPGADPAPVFLLMLCVSVTIV
jgi:hypothetical protein